MIRAETTMRAEIRVAGETHVGKVRTTNEDAFIVDPARGVYVVLDGMGGANAGEVASALARDTIHELIAHRRSTMAPAALLEAAIQAGSAAVFGAAQANREQHGMGTTVVACLVVDARRVVIGHVGDSRAYLLRHGRLQTLTRDHTIVEELVQRGLLSADDAERHPYKNVLSRNLGARAETRVDVLELELAPGDRLLLCSDGLYGYASAEGIQYILGSGDEPEHVTRDLIDLALRGGGGDNVTAIVLETPPDAVSSTQIVRTNGAAAWWQRRQRFLQLAHERGLTRSPIASGLGPDEALELIGLSLCEAVYHDLERSTGVNVWTFAQNLAAGWFGQGGAWAPLRDLMDILVVSAQRVVDELRADEPHLGFLLEIAVSRALVVAELALGGALGERLRQVDAELIALYTATVVPGEPVERASDGFIDTPTIPMLRPDRPAPRSPEAADIAAAIEKALTIARARTTPRAGLVLQVLTALETIAADDASDLATAAYAARELYGVRPVEETALLPLFDALDQARILTVACVHQVQATEPTRARALRALSVAHQHLVSATAGLVLEAAAPHAERLREAQAATAALRDRVARAERRRAELERRFAGSVDPSLPWGARGTTEW